MAKHYFWINECCVNTPPTNPNYKKCSRKFSGLKGDDTRYKFIFAKMNEEPQNNTYVDNQTISFHFLKFLKDN